MKTLRDIALFLEAPNKARDKAATAAIGNGYITRFGNAAP
jgi:hypothetical protein